MSVSDTVLLSARTNGTIIITFSECREVMWHVPSDMSIPLFDWVSYARRPWTMIVDELSKRIAPLVRLRKTSISRTRLYVEASTKGVE
jgi:hypothetical protein